jgi:hypothetical protein
MKAPFPGIRLGPRGQLGPLDPSERRDQRVIKAHRGRLGLKAQQGDPRGIPDRLAPQDHRDCKDHPAFKGPRDLQDLKVRRGSQDLQRWQVHSTPINAVAGPLIMTPYLIVTAILEIMHLEEAESVLGVLLMVLTP